MKTIGQYWKRKNARWYCLFSFSWKKLESRAASKLLTNWLEDER
jgi:hypothetical protein